MKKIFDKIDLKIEKYAVNGTQKYCLINITYIPFLRSLKPVWVCYIGDEYNIEVAKVVDSLYRATTY